jgi:hypothetical protein
MQDKRVHSNPIRNKTCIDIRHPSFGDDDDKSVRRIQERRTNKGSSGGRY